jgi:FPC/CPF motif-containing protein YcgG
MYFFPSCPHAADVRAVRAAPAPCTHAVARPRHGLQQSDASQGRRNEDAHQQFLDYAMDPAFPCVGARSALNRSRYKFVQFGPLGDPGQSAAICNALYSFLDEYPSPGLDPVSFIAAFEPADFDELTFEKRLWQQLQSMHEVDRQSFVWDPSVSSDPASARFSFSIGGRGLFVVGLHPHASRLARRAPAPTLVFNLHEQFEGLRESGKFATLQKAIRKRDKALQGSLNPVLAQFGEASEALQYSGRAVTPEWACPFRPGVPQ